MKRNEIRAYWEIINLKKSLLANSNSDFVLAIKPVLISSLVKAYAENDSLSLAKTNFKEFEKLYRKNTTEKNRNLYVDAKKTFSTLESMVENSNQEKISSCKIIIEKIKEINE